MQKKTRIITIVLLSLVMSTGCTMFTKQQDKHLRTVLASDIPLDCKIGFTEGIYVGESKDNKLQLQLEALGRIGVDKESKTYRECFVNGVQVNIAGDELFDKVMKCIGGACKLVIK